MRRATFKRPGFGSLTAVAAWLLIAWQTLAVQHVHADELEPACVVCVSAQHDDEALPVARLDDCEQPVSTSCLADLDETPRAVEQPRQLARSPPTR